MVRMISRQIEDGFALNVQVVNSDSTISVLRVNPYTGAIQGEEIGQGFPQFMRALHGWLLIPFTNGFSLGWYIVSAFGLPLLGSAVTGVLVYKKFWRAFTSPQLRTSHGSRVFWGDFHRLVGVFLLPFLAIISVSSIWFLARAILSDAHIPIFDIHVPSAIARESVPVTVDGAPASRVTLDVAIQAARAAFPQFTPYIVKTPQSSFGFVEVYGRGAYPLLTERVYVNPYNAKVDWSYTLLDRSTIGIFVESMRPLHTGDFMGLWLKVLYFLFGFALTLLVLSGVIVWTKRTAIETRQVVASFREAILSSRN